MVTLIVMRVAGVAYVALGLVAWLGLLGAITVRPDVLHGMSGFAFGSMVGTGTSWIHSSIQRRRN